ncbi:MAG: kinase [Candidatus Omnitrophica bacterium]|nr:kinase [Candidatus Omnitrophota bacterium]
MIISRTPFRVSFFGGGTDYPAWYREYGGATLAASVRRYCYITSRWLPPFFEYASRIVWSQIELVKDAQEIQHPAVREALQFLRIRQGIALHHEGDLPARTGLGSSSAFTVGLLHALYGLKGMMPSKMQLAQDAIHVEQVRLKENVGSQDQVTAAFGGFNRIDFGRDDTIHVSPIVLDGARLKMLEEHLLLVYTGISRTASDIAGEQIRVTQSKRKELTEIQGMVDAGIGILQGRGDLDEFGKLLHESWKLKRGLTTKISTSRIDEIYEAALGAGAVGGKLLGAGGGGFLLLFAKPRLQRKIREALSGLLHVPIHFDHSGSRIIFYDPDDDPLAVPFKVKEGTDGEEIPAPKPEVVGQVSP